MYKINHQQVEELLAEIENRLSQIEVKGDSVQHLFYARMGFRQLTNSIEKVPDSKHGEEKKQEG